ncbi:MAG: branched-chain amino acid ABC transporter permease [Actinomycetota bacterium]
MGQTLVFGFIQGGIYALIAAGIVLVYKGSRVLNFAQAEIGTLGLYVASSFVFGHKAPYALGALVVIAFSMGLSVSFEAVAVRRMTQAPRVTVAVATIGLLSAALGAESRIFGPSPRSIPPPIQGLGVKVAGVIVSPSQILSVFVVAFIAIALTAFLRYTDFGLGVLASAQDLDAARLMGVSAKKVSIFVWGTAGALSGIAALLIIPTVGFLSPGALAGLFLGGLTSALVGGLESLPGAFAGGFLVGIVEAIVKQMQISFKWALPGVSTLGLFAVIAIMLLLRPRGLLGRRA